MAIVNIYEDIFAEKVDILEVDEKKSISDVINNYLETKKDEVEVFETYDLETGETKYISSITEKYKVLTFLNDLEVPIDYIIQESDVISIIFIPEKAVPNWIAEPMATIGGFASIIGGIAMIIPGGQVFGGILIAVGAGLTLWAGLSMSANSSGDDSKKREDGLSSEQNLGISGSSNQPIVGNRYPFVMGKHLTNPQIVGSPYNITLTKNMRGEDAGNYLVALYCLGYSPLKVTDFKIGEVWAAYNKSFKDKQNIKTISHGILHDISDTLDDDGEILRKWKNNDLSFEILQKGDFAVDDEERYGSIYNRTCIQDEINANLLKIQDGTIEEVADRAYKGVNVPNGFQTNSVRFSASCPKRIEVELDFPQGLYASRSYQGNPKYYNLPVRLAVQWRFVKEGQASSNSLSPDGWNDFDYIELADVNGVINRIKPQLYTISDKIFDYKSSLGKKDYLNLSDSKSINDFVYQDAWVDNGNVFNFGTEDVSVTDAGYSKYILYIERDTEPTEADILNAKSHWSYKSGKADIRNSYNYMTYEINRFEDTYKGCMLDTTYCVVTIYLSQNNIDLELFGYGKQSTSSPEQWFQISKADYKRFLSLSNERDFSKENPYQLENNTGYIWNVKISSIGIDSFKNNVNNSNNITNYEYTTTDFKDNYGVNERQYTVVKEFTEEECRQMLNFEYTDAKKEPVILDSIEVRVIRINPSYFDQTQDSGGDWSSMTYQDLCKWKYLRTFTFDKDRYKKAFEKKGKRFVYSNDGVNFYKRKTFINEYKITPQVTPIKAGQFSYRIDDVSVEDFPQRPQSKEDMDKFTYVAIKLKQDVAETGGSSLNQFSCVVESLGPKYSQEEDKWYPEQINTVYKYFRKYKDNNDETQIEEYATEEEWNDAKINYPNDTFVKSKKGNDLVKQIKQEMFSEDNKIDDNKYEFPQTLSDKYATANTAAIGVLALTGPHLSVEAKTYDSINMYQATEMYKFCEDVTDGTPDEDSEDKLRHFKYSCNGIVMQEVKLETLLQKILITGRSNLKRDEENKYEFIIGKPIDYPVMMLNQKNCLSKSNTRSFDEVPSGLLINFVDETDNWGQNDIYIMDDGENYKNPTKEVESYNFQYVTNREQIWSLGRFNLGCRLYQREIYTREVGKAGYLLSYGDKVLLQDETLLVGTDNGGRIKELIQDEGRIYGFIINDLYNYTGETEGEIGEERSVQGVTILQSTQAGYSRCVTLRLALPNYHVRLNVAHFEKPKDLIYASNLVTKEVIDSRLKSISNEYYIYNDECYAYDGAQLFKFRIKDETNACVYITNREDLRIDEVETVVHYDTTIGMTNVVLFDTPIDKASNSSTEFNESAVYYSVTPKIDDLVAFGLIDAITIEAIVTSIKPKDKERFTLTLAPYNEGLYSMGKKMVEFKSNMTNPARELTEVNFNFNPTMAQVMEAAQVSASTAVITGGENMTNPSTPVITVTAERDGLRIIFTLDESAANNNISNYIYTIKRKDENNNEIEVVSGTSRSSEIFYTFNRDVDGYPEVDDFNKWKITGKVTNIYSRVSAETIAPVDTYKYGTWILTQPTVDHKSQDRTISLTCYQPPRADTREVYGPIKYRIRVKRITDGYADTDFFKPNISGNPYDKDSDTTYKVENDSGYVLSDGVYLQVMPLINQQLDNNSIMDTTYAFEVTAQNEAGTSEPVEVYTTAFCTSLRDIVKANENVKNMYVGKLSAISANLGVITDGSIVGDSDNYWALSDIPASPETDGKGYKKGEFRIGDDTNYIQYIPPTEDDNGLKIRATTLDIGTDYTHLKGEVSIYPLDPTQTVPALQVFPNDIRPDENQVTVNGNFKASNKSVFGSTNIDFDLIRYYLGISEDVLINFEQGV